MGRRASTTPKPKKTFKDLFASYKTYNPDVEGFGDREDWAGSFYERMGFEEAQTILYGQEETPFTILGISPKAVWEEIKRAYRKVAMEVHPDQCANSGLSKEEATEKFKKVQAAYSILCHQFGRS